MESNSVSDLEKKLQSRVAEQAEIVATIVSEEYKILNKKLKELSKKELSTIMDDMEEQIQKTKQYMKLGWLKTFSLVLILMITTGVGTWGYTKYLTVRIQSLHTEYQQSKNALKELGNLSVPIKVVESQIWTNKKPTVFQSQDGTWVIDLK